MPVALPERKELLSRIGKMRADNLYSLSEIDAALGLQSGKSRSHIGTDGKFFPCMARGSRGKKQYTVDVIRRYVLLIVLTNGINGTFYKFPDAKDKILSLDLNKLWSAYSGGEGELLQVCTSSAVQDVGNSNIPPPSGIEVADNSKAAKRGAS